MNSDPKGKRHVLRSYRRSRKLPDLNALPNEIREQEGTSSQAVASPLDGGEMVGPHTLPETIDVEEIDDDVVVSSPRSFAEAKFNADRTRGREPVVELDLERTNDAHSNRNKRKRVPSSQTIVNCDVYINLEGSSSSNSLRDIMQPYPTAGGATKETTFNCPICMGPFVEEVSTKCGHIFCRKCIKSAIAVQARCPTCRKKVVTRELIRVFLPATG